MLNFLGHISDLQTQSLTIGIPGIFLTLANAGITESKYRTDEKLYLWWGDVEQVLDGPPDA